MKRQATLIESENKKQYHIACEPGDIAPYIMLVGDPGRVKKVAAHFSKISIEKEHREFVTITGIYQDMPLTVMGTGIGHDNTEIALIELAQLQSNATIIRCGTSSTLQKNIKIGSLAISQGSMRLESTTLAYAPPEYPALADAQLLIALKKSCESLNYDHAVGITASTCGFYAPQGRTIPPFPNRQKNLIADLSELGVLNMEMETATVFVLSQLKKFRAAAVCGVIGNRITDEFASETEAIEIEKRCILATLTAFKHIYTQDHS